MPPTSDLFLLLYDFQSLKVGMSTASRATFANAVHLHSADDISVAFKLLLAIHRNTWTTATISTSFPDEDRLRSRPERQFWDFPMADRALILVQNRVLAVPQLRKMVIEILRHLPEFNPGDQRLIEDEWALGCKLGAVSLATVTINITRHLATLHRACSAAGQSKPFPDLFVEVHEGLKKKEIGDLRVNRRRKELVRVLNDLIWGLIEAVRDLRRGIGDFNSRDLGSLKKKMFFISLRISDENRRRIEENGRWFSERRRIGIFRGNEEEKLHNGFGLKERELLYLGLILNGIVFGAVCWARWISIWRTGSNTQLGHNFNYAISCF